MKTGISGKVAERGTTSGMVCFRDCAWDENTDYPGLDLNLETGRTSDRTSSAFACQELCSQNNDCKFFGWKAGTGECWMKTGISGKVAERGTTSGMVCFRDCAVYENTDYPGLDLNLETGRTSDRTSSALACQELCHQNRDCKFFGWKARTGECWMKTAISRTVAELGTISGPACRN